MTGERLAQIFESCLKEGWGYVLGAQGELYSAELAEKWAKTRNHTANYYAVDCKRWYGHRVADCSGGIVAAMRTEDAGFKDRTANGFKAGFTASGSISQMPESRGLAVWKSGHIGVYVGGGDVIEFRGYKYGCVKTRLADRPWTLWGRLPGVTYEEGDMQSYPRQMAVNTKKDALNLRDVPITGTVVCKMPKGAPVWAQAEQTHSGAAWVNVVYFNGSKYYEGWASKEYLI